jgi:hypothetical protein
MIIKEHEDFAREVVEVARKHGMTHLQMSFQLGIRVRQELGLSGDFENVRMDWTQGRHGEHHRIRLETNAAKEIPESKGGQS